MDLSLADLALRIGILSVLMFAVMYGSVRLDIALRNRTKEEPMDVYMIWIRFGDGVIALHDAWDDDTILENRSGYLNAIEEAERDCEPARGGAVRVVKTRVDLGEIEKAFSVPEVANSGVTPVEVS